MNHCRVSSFFSCRIKLLSIMKNKQTGEIDELERKRVEIEEKGAKLKTLCHNIRAKQKTFEKR